MNRKHRILRTGLLVSVFVFTSTAHAGDPSMSRARPAPPRTEPEGTIVSIAGGNSAITDGMTYFLPKRMVKVTIKRSVQKIDEVQKGLVAAQTALKEATDAAKTAKSRREDLEAMHKGLTEDDPYYAESRKEVSKAKAQEALAVSKQTESQNKVTELTAEVQRILAFGGAICTYEATIELQPAQADPRVRFTAKPHHTMFRDDTTKLAVSPAGLLTSANVVTVDRTSDVIVNLAGTMGIAGEGPRAAFSAPPTPAATCGDGPKQFTQIFDPAEADELLRTRAELIASKFPFSISVTEGNSGKPVTAAPLPKDLARIVNDTSKPGGLYYRTPLPAVLTLKQGDQPVASTIVLLPQAGPISYIPTKASPFVKTVSDVTFADGTISTWNLDRPSEAVEIFSLPVKAAKALVSVPAELLSVKIDYSDKAKALAVSQKAQMESAENLYRLKTCLELARQNNDEAAAFKCLSLTSS